MRQLRIAQLFEDNREDLQLTFLSGDDSRSLRVDHTDFSPSELVGYFNPLRQNRLQVGGNAEIDWISTQTSSQQHYLADAAQAPALIIADGAPIPPELHAVCQQNATPLFSSPLPVPAVVDRLRDYVGRKLAEMVGLHGVFMDVFGLGVLITGDSGVGKSELGLELISRGHGLVADDVVEFSRLDQNTLEGRCPPMLRDFLEVRGIGLLNIRTVFGETACRRKMRLRLIVHLQRMNPTEMAEAPRLPIDNQEMLVLGVPVRRVVLPVAAGRNLAVLIEGATRTTILQLRGINCMQEFIERQQAALREGFVDE